VAQWDKEDCENMGIIKVDLLGLGMMAAMQDAFTMIRARGVSIDLASIPKDDVPTYELMQRADTVGVFQIESRAQMATLPRMKPHCFYDVVVEVAIIRPGPIQGKMVNPYLERRSGKAPVEYFDDRLIPVLERTLGVPLFQEQILKMAMIMADISGSEAEDLRRAISFYRNFERIEMVVAKLIDSMRERAVPEETIRKVVEAISSFSNYGFPESHAISFAILAYASCYLKVHYPAEFYAALLNNQPMGFYSPATLVQDARRRELRVLPVCVAASLWDCTVVDPSTIRLGLCRVNGVSRKHAMEMLEARSEAPFDSLRDLRLRTGFDRDECRRLAAIGALNAYVENRRDALWAVEELIDREGLFARRDAEAGPGGESADSPLQPMNPRERLAADYAGTGLTVGNHPMGSLRPHLPGILTARDLESGEDGAWVTIAGQVICRQRPGTAKGFVFISMEDETGISNTIVTPKFFEAYRLTITQERYLKISGRLQSQDGVIHVKAQKIEALTVADLPASASYDFH
jgi:error-prone DNA polymerase